MNLNYKRQNRTKTQTDARRAEREHRWAAGTLLHNNKNKTQEKQKSNPGTVTALHNRDIKHTVRGPT